MKPTSVPILSFLFALMSPAWAALDYLVLDSSKPGPTLIVYAPEAGAGFDALRQLQQTRTGQGCLVLARPQSEFKDTGKSEGWESAPEFASLTTRFRDAHVLVFREDQETHSYDPRFHGDTVQGNDDASSAILKALRGLDSTVAGKDWQELPANGQDRQTVVTTNARMAMEAGLRPALRERELRTAASAMLRHLKMVEEGGENSPLLPASRPGQIRVAIFDGPGAQNQVGRGPAWLRSRLAHTADLIPELVGPPEILQGVLDQADVLVLGGGRANLQWAGLGQEGREAIMKFVRNGGGFVGICAGAYTGGNSSAKWKHLELLPVDTEDPGLECITPLVWSDCPLGEARIENADLHGGPSFKLVKPGSDSVTVWARFEHNETSPEKGEYPLKGTPAVISGVYGKGKVVLTTTHCERPPSSSTIFPDMVRWSARSVSANGE